MGHMGIAQHRTWKGFLGMAVEYDAIPPQKLSVCKVLLSVSTQFLACVYGCNLSKFCSCFFHPIICDNSVRYSPGKALLLYLSISFLSKELPLNLLLFMRQHLTNDRSPSIGSSKEV